MGGSSPRGFAHVEELIDEALQSGLGSAIAVSIGGENQEYYRLSRGLLWRLPKVGPAIDDGSWFDLASLTKPMVTAALAMVFVDCGELDLERSVRFWLPDAATTATVAQLLGHAAGCAPHVRFFEQIKAGQLDGESTPRGALLRMARQYPLAYGPGQDTVYSDLGYLLLGHLLEMIGGDRLDRLYATHLARPLGLHCQFLDLDDTAVSPPLATVATELEPDGLVVGKVHDENARAGGGIFGHAGLFGRIGDVAAFARAVLEFRNGSGLIRAKTASSFFSRSAAGGSWRLGWDTPSPHKGLSHAGDMWPRQGTIGHLGFTGTSLWLDLDRGRWVALLSNRVHPSREGSAEGIKRLRRNVMDTAWQLLEEQGTAHGSLGR
jgi:serine-type D-Ala-D-Ala carboxypeptidase